MSSCRRSQAHGTHARHEPGDREATSAPWRHSQCSGSESLELSGRPVHRDHRSCLRTDTTATSQREPTWPGAPRGKFRSGGVRTLCTRSRQQLLGQVGLPIPRAPFFEAGSSPSCTGDFPASAADRAQAMIEDNMMQKEPRHERAGPPSWARSALSHCCERGYPPTRCLLLARPVCLDSSFSFFFRHHCSLLSCGRTLSQNVAGAKYCGHIADWDECQTGGRRDRGK